MRMGLRPMRRTRATAGFTLAEVLVSSLIIAFLLVSLLASFIAGRYVTQVAKHRAQATNVLSARIEYLKGLGDELALNSGPFVSQMNVSKNNDSVSIELVLQKTVQPFDSTMEVRLSTAVKPRID